MDISTKIFCKERNYCTRLHPSAESKYVLWDRNIYFFYEDSCILFTFHSCYFLHIEKSKVDNSQTQQIIVNLNNVEEEINSVNTKLNIRENLSVDSHRRVDK